MEKRFKNGLVLGKMMPPTNGHIYLINTAALQCETVYVMTCSRDNDPIPGKLRFTWLRKIYKNNPNVKIIHCTDENPQYPHEDINFWDIWYATVYSRIDELDVVFTGEDYGKPFAKCLGIKYVDVNRTDVPISATMVRNNPHKYWDYIPEVVRPYYTKKIVVVGAESTGKSTLVKQIAKYFDIPYVEEYGREYTDTIPDGQELTAEDFNHIAMVHSDRIRESLGEKFLIVDTEAIITETFGELYIGDGFHTKEIRGYMDSQYFDLWLLTNTDIPWVDDGTRDFPDREQHHNLILDELDDWSKGPNNWKEIRGVGAERTDMAIELVERFINYQSDTQAVTN